MRKEATVVVTSDKATKQTVISRTREEIVTSQEQRHISHEKVNTDVTYDCQTLPCSKNLIFHQKDKPMNKTNDIPYYYFFLLYMFTLLLHIAIILISLFDDDCISFFISLPLLIPKNVINLQNINLEKKLFFIYCMVIY